jgi:O-antigen ligase
MSAWPSQHPTIVARQRSHAVAAELRFRTRNITPRTALWLGVLVCALAVQGIAFAHSYLWAAPLLCLLIVAIATDLPLVPFLGLTFLVRVLTDGLSSPTSRHSGSLNLSGGIALLFILVAIGLIIRRRQSVRQAALAAIWLCFWTAVAVSIRGASTETIREGVREISIVALAVIVCNARGALSVSVVTRLIQVVGVASALLAIYQLATHTGLLIAGHLRSNGTFVHPNAAAIFFAIAAVVSLWRYIDNGRRPSDALFAVIYVIAIISTYSITGLFSLLVMLITFGALRPGAFRMKLGACAVAGVAVIAFLATPLGAERIANETSSNLSAARGTANTSFAWRLYKWGTLIPEWEQSPFLGQGLGATVTSEGTSENDVAGFVPHNEYLRYLVETGVVGLTILLGTLFMLVRRLARRRKTSPGALSMGTLNAMPLALAVIAGCLVDALADNTFLDSTTAYAAVLIVIAVLISPKQRDITSLRHDHRTRRVNSSRRYRVTHSS